MCYAGCNASCTNSPTAWKIESEKKKLWWRVVWAPLHHSFWKRKKNNQFRMWNNIITSDSIWCAPRFWLHISNDFTFHRNSITNLKHFISRYLQSFFVVPFKSLPTFWSQLAKRKPKDITTTIWKSLKKVMKTAHFIIHFII